MPGIPTQTFERTNGQIVDSRIGYEFRMLVQNLMNSHNSTLTQLDTQMSTLADQIRASGFDLYDDRVTDPTYLHKKAQYLILSMIRSTRFPASVEAEMQERTLDVLSGNGYADWLKIVDMAWRGHMGSPGTSVSGSPASEEPAVQSWSRLMIEIMEKYVGYAPVAEGRN